MLRCPPRVDFYGITRFSDVYNYTGWELVLVNMRRNV